MYQSSIKLRYENLSGIAFVLALLLLSAYTPNNKSKIEEFEESSFEVLTKTSKIVVGAIAFENNPYDGNTLEEHLNQTEYLTESRSKTGIVDRGYKGKRKLMVLQ